MKKSSLRAFGVAFFIIGTFIAIAHHFQFNIPYVSLPEANQSLKNYEKQIATLETKLDEANEHIARLESQSQKNEDTAVNDTINVADSPTKEENEVIHATLQIYSGISPYVIGKKLEDLGIVKNGLEVELYLARPEYARSIQIGEFELNSSMSIEDIAKIITGKGQMNE